MSRRFNVCLQCGLEAVPSKLGKKICFRCRSLEPYITLKNSVNELFIRAVEQPNNPYAERDIKQATRAVARALYSYTPEAKKAREERQAKKKARYISFLTESEADCTLRLVNRSLKKRGIAFVPVEAEDGQ